MRDNPINALRETLRCGFAFRKSRLESLCVLVFGVFVARTVNLSHLACHFPGRARSSSNYRRLQRFFEQVDFDYDRLAEFLVAMMGLQAGPWRLTMDRTNWRLGRRDVNILMIGIVNRAIAIPVCWRVLDKAGNSNTKERIAILEHVLRLFGVDKIASLLADREFIGDAWLAWLQEKAIPFHIRIRSNIKIANTRGRMVKARELFRDLKPGESRILSNARRLSEARKPKARPVFVAALHLKTGELLIVVTNDAPEEALAIYAQRWQIETLFAALKTRGFNLEDTHMTKNPCAPSFGSERITAFFRHHGPGSLGNLPSRQHALGQKCPQTALRDIDPARFQHLMHLSHCHPLGLLFDQPLP